MFYDNYGIEEMLTDGYGVSRMKVVVSMDSFKGSVSSLEAGDAVRRGILSAFPADKVRVFPLADGGEGTVDALTAGSLGSSVPVTVTGPLGTPIPSRYGWLADKGTAVIEMADAAGLTLVPEAQRNPLDTTTYGLGELIAAAYGHGARHFLIGIGGSATNDCGLGMLAALGVCFGGISGVPFGRDLARVRSIDAHALARYADCTFDIACDVKNPLCGETGCSHIFSPQKGASPAVCEQMDQDIAAFAHLAGKAMPEAEDAMRLPGAGAAGGLGFAFHTFLHGSLTPGAPLVLRYTGIEADLPDADVLITGEGCLDAQTAMGKAPAVLAARAKQKNPACLTIALGGACQRGADAVNAHGIDAYFPILPGPMREAEAMGAAMTKENLARTSAQILRLLHPRMERLKFHRKSLDG